MRKRTTYSWRANISELDPFSQIKTDHLPAVVVDNCSIYVSLTMSLTNYRTARLKIHKTNLESITVDINLHVNHIEEEKKRSYPWRKTCLFRRLWSVPADGLIDITCGITWTLPEATAPPSENDGISSFSLPPALLFPTENFLMSSSFSDVTIVIDKKELPAHKLILAGQSPVFFQMLSSPMKETLENRVVIEDIDFETMKTVLTLLYTDNYQALSDVSVACNVLGAAHKYNIERLTNACIYHLYKKIDAKTVLQILKTADLYQVEKLKQECWKFIIQNKKEIIPTVKFQDFCLQNPVLLNQFMTEIVKAYP